jgi:hypothetical protein
VRGRAEGQAEAAAAGGRAAATADCRRHTTRRRGTCTSRSGSEHRGGTSPCTRRWLSRVRGRPPPCGVRRKCTAWCRMEVASVAWHGRSRIGTAPLRREAQADRAHQPGAYGAAPRRTSLRRARQRRLWRRWEAAAADRAILPAEASARAETPGRRPRWPRRPPRPLPLPARHSPSRHSPSAQVSTDLVARAGARGGSAFSSRSPCGKRGQGRSTAGQTRRRRRACRHWQRQRNGRTKSLRACRA